MGDNMDTRSIDSDQDDRAWRERERPVQRDEFGRDIPYTRERSPAPPMNDRGRMKRRRSPSPLMDRGPYPPYGYDRYAMNMPPADPYYRPYRDDYERGYAPSRYPPRPRRIAPENLPYLVKYVHFEEHIQDTYPDVFEDKKRLEQAWQLYRSEFYRKLHKGFFDEQKDKPWFRERYFPGAEEVQVREQLKARGRLGLMDDFLSRIENGDFNDLSLEFQAGKKDASDNKEENGEANTENGKPTDKREEHLQTISPEKELVIKAVPLDTSRSELEAHCAQAEGFDYLNILDPIPHKKFQRVAFIVFKPDADIDAAEKLLGESKIGEFTLHISQTKPSTSRIRLLPSAYSEIDRLAKDSNQAHRLLARLEAESGDKRASEAIAKRLADKDAADEAAGIEKSDEYKLNIPQIRYKLDLTVQALRVAYNTCYYCAAVCTFPEELSRRCVRHLRRPAEEQTSKGGRSRDNYSNTRAFDEKIGLLIEPEALDLLTSGLDDYAGELSKQCAPNINEEDDGSKFRCNICSKLFKARTFIEKHILNKHSDHVDLEVLANIQYYNNYILDTSRAEPEHPDSGERRGQPSEPPPHMHMSGYAAPMGMGRPGDMRALSDRIGDRMYTQDYKRPRRELLPPEGSQPDPRASRTTSYKDLDSTVPTGDLELEY